MSDAPAEYEDPLAACIASVAAGDDAALQAPSRNAPSPPVACASSCAPPSSWDCWSGRPRTRAHRGHCILAPGSRGHGHSLSRVRGRGPAGGAQAGRTRRSWPTRTTARSTRARRPFPARGLGHGAPAHPERRRDPGTGRAMRVVRGSDGDVHAGRWRSSSRGCARAALRPRGAHRPRCARCTRAGAGASWRAPDGAPAAGVDDARDEDFTRAGAAASCARRGHRPEHAHAGGIARDVKPSNILIRP